MHFLTHDYQVDFKESQSGLIGLGQVWPAFLFEL
jgi:hypothetical protein